MPNKPKYGNGKICYLEIPASDIEKSSKFFEACLGWKVRNSGDGQISFDDGVGEVSGTWVADRQPIPKDTIVISIMVSDADATCKLIASHGGKVLDQSTMDSGEKVAYFADPYGNHFGLYQPNHKV